MNDRGFSTWFKRLTEHAEPHPWQLTLGQADQCAERLVRIPTGLGKTEGVLAAWSYHRIEKADESWPRRLVWCLPTRVLVEQTMAAAEAMVQHMDEDHRPLVSTVMGGQDAGDWYLQPEKPTILIGTQDMLSGGLVKW